jgi:hypothetical protein
LSPILKLKQRKQQQQREFADQTSTVARGPSALADGGRSTCQHMSAHVSTCQHMSAHVSTCQHMSASISCTYQSFLNTAVPCQRRDYSKALRKQCQMFTRDSLERMFTALSVSHLQTAQTSRLVGIHELLWGHPSTFLQISADCDCQ